MNSYQLKQTARSRRNNAQKVQRPLLNFKASKDKAKDRRKSSSNRSWRILNTRVVPIFLTSMQATMSSLHGCILMISNAKLTRT